MADVFVSTNWYPSAGREDEFAETWREALTWTKETFGDRLERARLLRDEEERGHFVSFIEWADRDAREEWFAHPGFEERITKLQAMCSESQGAGYEEAVRVG